MPDPRDVEELLPLKPVVHEILLALAEGPSHGYGIIRTVRDRSGGRTRLRTGVLYHHLSHLLEAGLVEETDERPADDDPRRGAYYRLTELGRAAVAAEASRLDEMVRRTRALGILPEEGAS